MTGVGNSRDRRSTLTIPLKQWKSSMIESHGDYRSESFLEQYIGGPLYENQGKLPKLPVPSIEETIGRFLPTALPLAKTEEEKMELKELCKQFPKEAKVLQERLVIRRDEAADSSWLQLWWNQVRLSVVMLSTAVWVKTKYSKNKIRAR